MKKRVAERVWERGWEGHAGAQMLRLAGLPFEEKLRWLEQAQRLADALVLAKAAAVRAKKRKR